MVMPWAGIKWESLPDIIPGSWPTSRVGVTRFIRTFGTVSPVGAGGVEASWAGSVVDRAAIG